jgi:hypothetical protein
MKILRSLHNIKHYNNHEYDSNFTLYWDTPIISNHCFLGHDTVHRQYASLKHLHVFTDLSVLTNKTTISAFTSVNTSDVIHILSVCLHSRRNMYTQFTGQWNTSFTVWCTGNMRRSCQKFEVHIYQAPQSPGWEDGPWSHLLACVGIPGHKKHG